MACHDWSMWHTVSFFFLLRVNRMTKTKSFTKCRDQYQTKKAQRPMLKLSKNAETKHTFKSLKNKKI